MKRSVYSILSYILILIFTHLSASADNLYHYIETLPKSISSRNYSRFERGTDIVFYVDSCCGVIDKLRNKAKPDSEKLTRMCIEVHDLIDQFPDYFMSKGFKSASEYMIIALENIEKQYGIDSPEFANIFADYIGYHSDDRLKKTIFDLIVYDAFSPGKDYTQRVKYKKNRLSPYEEIMTDVIFTVKNSELEAGKMTDLMAKELIWWRLRNKEEDGGILVRMINGLEELALSELDINQKKERDLITLDFTGLMLMLYPHKGTKEDKKRYNEKIRTYTDLVEKHIMSLKPVRISRGLNSIHILAYLQAWKQYISRVSPAAEEIKTIDKIAEEVYSSVKIKPRSLVEAYKLFFSDPMDISSPDYPKINRQDEDVVFEYLAGVNYDVKKSGGPFKVLERLMPPISQSRAAELSEIREYHSFVNYANLCLDYIDKYYDTFGLLTERSSSRSDTSPSGSLSLKYGGKEVSIERILDYVIGYILESSNYSDPGVPSILARYAEKKYWYGTFSEALLYAEFADNLFTLSNSGKSERIINNCILALSEERVEGSSDKIFILEGIAEIFAEYVKKDDAREQDFLLLINLCNTLSEYYLIAGNATEAKSWNQIALDAAYSRNEFSRGGSIVTGFQDYLIPLHYYEWEIGKALNLEEQKHDGFNSLWRVIYNRLMLQDIPLDMVDILAKVLRETHQTNKESYDEEDIVDDIIRESEVFRQILIDCVGKMHPAERERLSTIVQTLLRENNGLLASFDSEEANECISNNLILAGGLKLQGERMIKESLLYDEKCRELHEKYQKMRAFKPQELVGFYRSDNYARMIEERALAVAGLDEVMALNLTSVKEAIDDREAVIQFLQSPYSDHFHALIVTKDDVQRVELCDISAIPDQNPTGGFRNVDLDRLSKLIWNPLKPHLRDKKKLYIVPDGLLNNLPLESLPYSDEMTVSDVFPVIRLSSPKTLCNKRGKSPRNSAALFGGMNYDVSADLESGSKLSYEMGALPQDTTLYPVIVEIDMLELPLSDFDVDPQLRSIRATVGDLPNSKIEVEDINQLFKRHRKKCGIYTGAAATERALRSLSGKAPDILHIATHGRYWNSVEEIGDSLLWNAAFFINKFGEFDPNNPLNRSVLMFAGANRGLLSLNADPETDGVMTAEEISQLDLRNIDLLVLSACQTGLGDIEDDGIFGLQRGFKKAGVNSIIMSLWEVDDESTRLFMTEFYKGYLQGMSKYDAFQAAQRYVRNIDPHARKWASFILLDALD